MLKFNSKENDDMGRCYTCQSRDVHKSTENWITCPNMPLDVIIDLNSRDCENYKSIEEGNSSNKPTKDIVDQL